jgi:hypothetical protein
MVELLRFLLGLAVISLAAGLLIFPVTVNAQAGGGSFQFSVRGWTVSGYLYNAVVQSNGNVTLQMAINNYVDTPIGYLPVNGTGVWEGVRSGTGLSGTVQNVTGTVYACYIFWCGDTSFIGAGQWRGTLNGSSASGLFSGTITFTSSPFSQIPLNTPQPVTGTWNAQFQLPITTSEPSS